MINKHKQPMVSRFARYALALLILALPAERLIGQEPPNQSERPRRPDRSQPGPWNNDVLVFKVSKSRTVEQIGSFPRAGVPTLARLTDGRLMAAHQHFPADNDVDFDKVAVRFSTDEGQTWSNPKVIRLNGLPEGMRFPFDPTLVPLPDSRVRLYFTSLKGRRIEAERPAIYSAISSNAIDFTVEPGVRFGIEGRPVIDCAVALHEGVFHLFAPDNGAANNFGAPGGLGQGQEGIGYYATSKDGLSFVRQADLVLEPKDGRRWLGNAQSDGNVIRFFGTGGPRGIWTATSTNGRAWVIDPDFPQVMAADPGAVKLKDGGWLIAATGPPRENLEPRGEAGRNPGRSLMDTLDANGDGSLDEWELDNAAKLLRKLDQNRDGRLSAGELGEMRRDPVSSNRIPR